MTRRTFITAAMLSAAVVWLLPLTASADDAKAGEIWITLKGNDFAKPFLDGEEYADHEFLDMGKKLVIRVSDISVPYTFELRPSIDSFGTETISTEGKKYKRTRVRGAKLPRLVLKMKVTFKEQKEAPKK